MKKNKKIEVSRHRKAQAQAAELLVVEGPAQAEQKSVAFEPLTNSQQRPRSQ